MTYIHDNSLFGWTEEDGVQYALRIRQDDMSESPRTDGGNLCTMACWHGRYGLGDQDATKDASPEDFWRSLVRQNVFREDILSAAVNGKLPGIRIEKEEDGTLDVYETYEFHTIIGNTAPEERLEYEGVPAEAIDQYLVDDLTIGHCMTLLEPHMAWLPLWLYDHSGLTMSCGSRTFPYNDRWDSGQVGWILVSKDRIMSEVGTEYVLDEHGDRIQVMHEHGDGMPATWSYKTRPLTDDTWRNRAEEIMRGEVELYDNYLRGEVYGYELYERDSDTDWSEIDSCWGFYGDTLEENGMLDCVGYGLNEAVETDRIKTGSVEEEYVANVNFVF